jgi:spore coat polysaccharide biosynthesis protein SpsF
MNIGFYTYGNHSMGMGHVYRSLAIERALRAVWPQAEFLFELEDHADGVGVVARAGSSARVWPIGQVPRTNNRWDILFVDQLDVAPTKMRELKTQAECLISLDDTGLGRYEADLAFNSLYRCRAPRPSGSAARVYDGLEYLLIDESFTNRDRAAASNPLRHVLITQGGADTYGLVPRLIEGLAPWAEPLGVTLHALIGPAFHHQSELQHAAAVFPHTVKIERGLNDMAGLFSAMDAAVSAAGLTACELAAIGVPTLLITGEPKELETAAALSERGAALDFGIFSGSSLETLSNSLRALAADTNARQLLSNTAKKQIDGLGLTRMTALIQGALTL